MPPSLQFGQFFKHHKLLSVLLAVLLVFAALGAIEKLTPAKEIALIIGEPWKDMQARSTADIGEVYEGRHWYREPEQLSYLRFAYPAHEFITPPAKFFTVGFDDDGNIDGVRMSPQVKPLPLQDALNVILDLQDQWRKAGWILTDPKGSPAHENTSWWKEEIAKCHAPDTFWHVPDKYQVVVGIGCYEDRQHPDEKRFLIYFSMGKHRYKPWEYDSALDPRIPIR